MKPQKPESSVGEESTTGSDCGEKFRAMLKCVERDAAVPPCTHAINVFLACERAVFRSALNAQPPQGSTSGRSKMSSITREITREKRNFSHDTDGSPFVVSSGEPVRNDAENFPENNTREHPERGRQHGKSPPQRPTSEWLLFPSWSTLEFVQRAIEKQARACTKLVHVVAQPDYPQRLTSFCKRIGQDMYLSFSLVAQRVATKVRSERDSKDQ